MISIRHSSLIEAVVNPPYSELPDVGQPCVVLTGVVTLVKQR